MQQTRTAGFTLVEIAIVLLIIGLVAGGVLIGRDLIRASEIRATVRQIEEFDTAVHGFKLKFGCLPGDCAAAAELGLSPNDPAGNYVGNGDGIIGLTNQGPCPYYTSGGSCPDLVVRLTEYHTFWTQLHLAGLIAYHILTYPELLQLPLPSRWYSGGNRTPPVKLKATYTPSGIGAIDPPGWTIHADVAFHTTAGGGSAAAHSLMLGRYSVRDMESSFFGGYAPVDMHAIDEKIDDGLPLSGRVRAFSLNSVLPPDFRLYYHFSNGFGVGPPGANSPVCITNEPVPRYNVQYSGASDGGSCRIGIKAAF